MAQQIKVNSATGNIQIQISRGAIGPSTTANIANTALNLNAASTANVIIGGGVANYVLSTDGAGNTSWVAQTGGGATNPAGSNTQVQFNDQGSFGAEPNFTYDKATDVLTADHFSGEGGNLSNIQLANVTGAGNIASINLDGNVSNVLAGDGTFIAAGGGATAPGGSNTQVQYNDNGAFAGEAGFEYNDVTNTLTVDNISANISGTVTGDVDGALLVDVYNNTGVTLNKGDAVYLTGGNNGDNPHVALADADDPTKMPALGVVKENIATASVGQVTTSGVMNDSSHGYTLGADLYVSTTPGQLTTTIPTGEANLIQKIGKVVNANQIIVQGAFRTNATPNLDEGNIFIGNATNEATTANLYGEINTHLAAFGSNTITTTGNVETGNLTATTSLFVDGVNGNVLIQPNVALDGKTYSSIVRGDFDTVTANSATSQAFVTDNYTTQGITSFQTFANTAAGHTVRGADINFNSYGNIGNGGTDPLVTSILTLTGYPQSANLANVNTSTRTSMQITGGGADGFLTIIGSGASAGGYNNGAWKQIQYRDNAFDVVRRNGNADARTSATANDETSFSFYNTQEGFGPGTVRTYNYPAKVGSKVDGDWVDPQNDSAGIKNGLFFQVVKDNFDRIDHRMYSKGTVIFNESARDYLNAPVSTNPVTIGADGVITGDGGGLSNVSASLTGDGYQLANLTGANVTGEVGFSAVANSVAYANVSGTPTLGNIATINIDGDAANILYGNGVFAPAGGGGGVQAQIANGTSNVNIATANGNVDITVNGNTSVIATDTGTVIQNEPAGNITISPSTSSAYLAGGYQTNQYQPTSMAIYRRNGNSTNKVSSVANDETSIDFYNTQDRFGGAATGVTWNYPARMGSKVDPTWVDPTDASIGIPQGLFFTVVRTDFGNVEHRMYANGDSTFNASATDGFGNPISTNPITLGYNGVITGDGGGLSNVSATASPGGFFDTIQFNNGGTLDGNSSFQFLPGSNPEVQLNGTASSSDVGKLSLQNSILDIYTENMSGGYTPMSFSTYNGVTGSGIDGFIDPINYFRARGTRSVPTAVDAGDIVKNERMQAYSGATATLAYAGGQTSTIQANDGLGNLAVTTTISTAKPANGPNSQDKILLDTEFVQVAGNIQMNNIDARATLGRIAQATVAFNDLPASPVNGERAMINNGPTLSSFGTIVSGGTGSQTMPLFWDGSDWRMG
mgnify:CR=1 FL=1